jgi:hypothetical protein
VTGETITRQRGTRTDSGRRGDHPIDWSNPDEETSTGWLITPKGSSEDNAGRSSVTDDLELYREGEAVDIVAADRLILRGDASHPYEVQGDPDVWDDPDDPAMASMTVTARKVKG